MNPVFLYASWGVKKCVGIELINQNIMEKFVAIRVMIDKISDETNCYCSDLQKNKK
jgi:hypothetical protein